MFIQLFEFWGWIADVVQWIQGTGTPLDWQAYIFLVVQIVIFAYCGYFLMNKQFPAYTVFYVVFWVDLMFSAATFAYTCVVVFLNNDALGDLAAVVILTIFFGSDIFMAGGMLYLMKNYVVVAPQTPMVGQYVLLNTQGAPMLYQAQPVFLPQYYQPDQKQVVMV